MIKPFVCFLFFFPVSAGISQSIGIGTNTPHASAALDIRSTNRGLLIPSMTLSQRNAINDPATGLLVFQSDGSAGFYYNSGTPASPAWLPLANTGNGWSLGGNSGTDTAIHFIGTTDNKPVILKVNNTRAGYIGSAEQGLNTSLGFDALTVNSFDADNNQGSRNTGIGYQALKNGTTASYNSALGVSALYSNTGGYYNTAIGASALYSNTADHNTAVGASALEANTTGSLNTAAGRAALQLNTTGSNNTAIGHIALASNRTGYSNVAIGTKALLENLTGSNSVAIGDSAMLNFRGTESNNTAVGSKALLNTTTGSHLTAVGHHVLLRNTTGTNNAATGSLTMTNNTTGYANTGNGSLSLYSNTTGYANVGIGFYSLNRNTAGSLNTAVGSFSLEHNVTGNFNSALGYMAGPNASANPTNFTAIGYFAGHVGSNSNTIEIGNTSVSWIGGQVGWSTYSDESIKDDIKPDVPGLAFIAKLRPVTYRLNITRQNMITGFTDAVSWKGKYDIENITQTGFLAQEVEQAAKECNYNFNGVTPPKGNSKLYSLQYSSFVVPMVKAIQEQQAIIDKQQQQIDQLIQDVNYLRQKPAH